MISGLGGGEVGDFSGESDEEGLGAMFRKVLNAAEEYKSKMAERLDNNEIVKAQFEEEEDPGEEELLSANKPFKGALKTPKYRLPHNSAKPEEEYELEYVYGYRSADSRQNVSYNCEGKVVYMTAAVGVVLDGKTNTQ